MFMRFRKSLYAIPVLWLVHIGFERNFQQINRYREQFINKQYPLLENFLSEENILCHSWLRFAGWKIIGPIEMYSAVRNQFISHTSYIQGNFLVSLQQSYRTHLSKRRKNPVFARFSPFWHYYIILVRVLPCHISACYNPKVSSPYRRLVF